MSEGDDFKPEANDLCKVCRCEKGFPVSCKRLTCPTHATHGCTLWEKVEVEGQCCHVINCIELPEEGDSGNATLIEILHPHDSTTGDVHVIIIIMSITMPPRSRYYIRVRN